MIDLDAIFGDGPAADVPPAAVGEGSDAVLSKGSDAKLSEGSGAVLSPPPATADAAADRLAGTPFAGWVLRRTGADGWAGNGPTCPRSGDGGQGAIGKTCPNRSAPLRAAILPNRPRGLRPVASGTVRPIRWTYRRIGPSRGIYRGLAGRENGQGQFAIVQNFLYRGNDT